MGGIAPRMFAGHGMPCPYGRRETSTATRVWVGLTETGRAGRLFFAMSEQGNSSTASKRWLTRGVFGIGLASLFSDWSHEAATSILPAFLASLGAPALVLGIIEGVSDGLASFAKLAGGWIADRPSLRKPTGVIGYFVTGISTFGYAFAQSWPAVLALRAFGWIGRGSRGPSRDALLADAVAPEKIGSAFGFERAMDTVGAVLGPLCASALV